MTAKKVDWSGAIVGRHASAIASARAQGAKVPDCQCKRCTGEPKKQAQHDVKAELELGHYGD